MVLLPIPQVVLAARLLALRPVDCSATQILAVRIHPAPLQMVLLLIPQVVLVVLPLALRPLDCSETRTQILVSETS